MKIKECGINILHFSVVSASKKDCSPMMQASFCFFFAPVANCILQFGYRREKKIVGVQRDAIPLALGFQ